MVWAGWAALSEKEWLKAFFFMLQVETQLDVI